MATNPQTEDAAANIIRAKETNPTGYDDILGKFRQNFVRKVEGAIQYHRDNAADPAKEFYRVGFTDPVNIAKGPEYKFGGVQNINGVPYYFTKNNAKITMADLLGAPAPILTQDGQVPYNSGTVIDGQTSFWDVNGGMGIIDGSEKQTDKTSVANAIINHTKVLMRVRMADIVERMGTTSKNWVSKTWPATFEGKTVQAKGDTLVQFEDLYGFPTTGSRSGLTFFVDPFQSAKDVDIFYQTIINDAIRGPRVDATETGEGGGEDPEGEIITAANIVGVFDRMDKLWEASKTRKATILLDYCHSSCHASCHSSRSRR